MQMDGDKHSCAVALWVKSTHQMHFSFMSSFLLMRYLYNGPPLFIDRTREVMMEEIIGHQ